MDKITHFEPFYLCKIQILNKCTSFSKGNLLFSKKRGGGEITKIIRNSGGIPVYKKLITNLLENAFLSLVVLHIERVNLGWEYHRIIHELLTQNLVKIQDQLQS